MYILGSCCPKRFPFYTTGQSLRSRIYAGMRIEIQDTLTVSGIETERLEDILTRSGE